MSNHAKLGFPKTFSFGDFEVWLQNFDEDIQNEAKKRIKQIFKTGKYKQDYGNGLIKFSLSGKAC
jgi:hypothetical protein